MGAFEIPKGKRLNMNRFWSPTNIPRIRNSDFRRHLADRKQIEPNTIE